MIFNERANSNRSRTESPAAATLSLQALEGFQIPQWPDAFPELRTLGWKVAVASPAG